jgi:cytidylate kinase
MTVVGKNKYIVVALDGAAGSGKSTTARAICKNYKYIHVDTGLHYRAISLHLLNINITPESAPEYLLSSPLILSSKLDEFSAQLFIDGIHYSKSELRTERMNREVSYYARLPEVRSLLLNYQRSLPDFGKNIGYSGIIMDGRDIGSVILPDADIKIFLHADLQVRQNRRSSDGETDSISTRDQIDSTRKIAPLTCPDDALSIDTGKLPLEQVLQLISKKIASLS